MILEKYYYLIIPLLVAVIAKIIKIVIELINGKFSLKTITGYGGMPSEHTALTVSLTTLIGLDIGLGNIFFALSLILTILITRDAVGFRRYLSDHSKAINDLIKDLPDYQEYKYKVQEERIGHTVGQVTAGAILGIFFTYLLFVLMV